MSKRQYAVLLPNIRSAHNVGSIFRTADAVGVTACYLSGYTPRPVDKFGRPQKEIAKTALWAEKYIPWEYEENTTKLLKRLKREGYLVVAIEQDDTAVDYKKFKIPKSAEKILFVVGNEVEGLSLAERKLCDHFVEIPMKGEKESLNVVVSFGIAIFRICNV